MATSLFLSLFGHEILVDYDGIVEESRAAEKATLERVDVGETHRKQLEREMRSPESEHRERETRPPKGLEREEPEGMDMPGKVAIAMPPEFALNKTSISILTTKDSVLLMSTEGRPLAEPPIFNYDWFVREVVPSDDKLNAMFPVDPVQRTAYRDMLTERGLLNMFEEWADDRRKEGGENRDRNREKFYEILRREIEYDTMPSNEEYYGPYNNRRRPSDLILWEEEFLDNDPSCRHTASLGRRIAQGEDPFTIYRGGEEARAKYGLLFQDMTGLPHPPRHDLETWEFHQLGGEGRRTARLEQKIWKFFNDGTLYLQSQDEQLRQDYDIPPFFTKAYYGGDAAKEKWGHLIDLGRWESRMLDPDGGTRRIRKTLENGETVLFTGTGAELAKEKYTPIFADILRDANHDLATWKRFQLDADGIGTTKIMQKIKAMTIGQGRHLRSHAQDLFFTHKCYGGWQARDAFGYLVWEAMYLDNAGSTRQVEKRLAEGEDIFQDWTGTSALPRYQHLLEKLPRRPSHDLKTWEAFNLDKDGKTTKIAKWLEKGTDLFEPTYYGGIQAREKYGWMYWACEHLSPKGFRSACRSGELSPSDAESFEKRLLCGEDIFHSWYGASARIKFGYLLNTLSLTPLHNLRTWEWFHVPGGTTETAVAELKAYKDIFDRNYYGGPEAREKWGFLAPKFVRDNWEGIHDIASRESMRVSTEPLIDQNFE